MPRSQPTSRSSKPRSRAPAHQNSFAFKHNPNSKKTAKILASPIRGVCDKCKEKLEWRKKYRKYKPLTQPKKCIDCKNRAITSAYHVVCVGCAKKRGFCCEMCLGEKKEGQEEGEEEGIEGGGLEGLRERERRTILRKRMKEKEKEKDRGEGGEGGEQGGGRESCDEFEDDEGEEEEEEGEEKEGEGEGETHFGGGADLFGCGASRNDTRFKF